eukprot:TRINITY_DN38151_c0_g1_i1.p1 TRINITY_DN38151_c0_g1~~TRINITY_DN38151_c0_g1_i1.p1  ORF type:complete len:301 (+),score=59.58 TRINITY_DN38151_c0_g1_i1:253-1155(+)
MTPKRKLVCGAFGVLAGVSVLLFIVLMIMSFKNIGQDEVAIKWHTMTRTVYPGVYTEGKHYVSPGQDFLKFKRRFVTLSFDGSNDNCLTKDGLVNSIHVTAQYQIKPDELHDILFEFGEQSHLETYIRRVAYDSFRTVCGNYTAEDFFLKRGEIESAMLVQLKKDYVRGEVHAEAGFVQLRGVTLPEPFSDAIDAKQLAVQDQQRAQNERAGRLVDANSALKLAREDLRIGKIEAEGIAKGIRAKAAEQVLAIKAEWAQKALAFKSVKERSAMTNNAFIEGYLTSQAVLANKGKSVIRID